MSEVFETFKKFAEPCVISPVVGRTGGYELCKCCGELLLSHDIALRQEIAPGVFYYSHRHDCLEAA